MNGKSIRMILSDVDGTLLSAGETQVSEKVFSAIRAAKEKNIEVVLASGRNYQDLLSLFSPVKHLVTFVCCDGTVAVKNDEVLFHAPVEKKDTLPFFDTSLYGENEALVVVTKDRTYIFGKKTDNLSKDAIPISSPDEISGHILKLTFFGLSDFHKIKIRTLAKSRSKFDEVYGGNDWLEFNPKGVHKGTACRALQKMLGISDFETVAFGDNINDFEMLRCATNSYSVPGAKHEIINMCKYRTMNVPAEILHLVQERGTL